MPAGPLHLVLVVAFAAGFAGVQQYQVIQYRHNTSSRLVRSHQGSAGHCIPRCHNPSRNRARVSSGLSI